MHISLALTQDQCEALFHALGVACEAYADKLELGSAYYSGTDIQAMEYQQTLALALQERLPLVGSNPNVDIDLADLTIYRRQLNWLANFTRLDIDQ